MWQAAFFSFARYRGVVTAGFSNLGHTRRCSVRGRRFKKQSLAVAWRWRFSRTASCAFAAKRSPAIIRAARRRSELSVSVLPVDAAVCAKRNSLFARGFGLALLRRSCQILWRSLVHHLSAARRRLPGLVGVLLSVRQKARLRFPPRRCCAACACAYCVDDNRCPHRKVHN